VENFTANKKGEKTVWGRERQSRRLPRKNLHPQKNLKGIKNNFSVSGQTTKKTGEKTRALGPKKSHWIGREDKWPQKKKGEAVWLGVS